MHAQLSAAHPALLHRERLAHIAAEVISLAGWIAS
jgi:hypothetical protein